MLSRSYVYPSLANTGSAISSREMGHSKEGISQGFKQDAIELPVPGFNKEKCQEALRLMQSNKPVVPCDLAT